MQEMLNAIVQDWSEGKINPQRAQIEMLDGQIKKLTEMRDGLKKDAVKKGFAFYNETMRDRAPSVKWWKENRPTVWKKHAVRGVVKSFTWL